MAKDLVAIKVKIELNAAGHAKYPNFNNLPSVLAAGMDWSHYIDRHGSGWLYDADGHRDDTADSPVGMQWGMILVPQAFANEAVAAFPTLCSKLTKAEAETFYNDKHARDMDEEEVDVETLQKIKAKQDLGLDLTATDLRALDPKDKTRGVKTNRRKKFTTFSVDYGFNVTNHAQ